MYIVVTEFSHFFLKLVKNYYEVLQLFIATEFSQLFEKNIFQSRIILF